MKHLYQTTRYPEKDKSLSHFILLVFFPITITVSSLLYILVETFCGIQVLPDCTTAHHQAWSPVLNPSQLGWDPVYLLKFLPELGPTICALYHRVAVCFTLHELETILALARSPGASSGCDRPANTLPCGYCEGF